MATVSDFQEQKVKTPDSDTYQKYSRFLKSSIIDSINRKTQIMTLYSGFHRLYAPIWKISSTNFIEASKVLQVLCHSILRHFNLHSVPLENISLIFLALFGGFTDALKAYYYRPLLNCTSYRFGKELYAKYNLRWHRCILFTGATYSLVVLELVTSSHLSSSWCPSLLNTSKR